MRTSRSGFTLLEVTLSLVILGMSLVVVYQIFTNTLTAGAQAVSVSEHRADMAFIRHQVLKLGRLDAVEQGGRVTTPDALEWAWQATVTPTDTLDLFELTLDIRERGSAAQPYRERLYVLRPTWATSADRQFILDHLEQHVP